MIICQNENANIFNTYDNNNNINNIYVIMSIRSLISVNLSYVRFLAVVGRPEQYHFYQR